MMTNELRRAIAEALGYSVRYEGPSGTILDHWAVLRHGEWDGLVSVGRGDSEDAAWDAAFEYCDGTSEIPDWTRDTGAALDLCCDLAQRETVETRLCITPGATVSGGAWYVVQLMYYDVYVARFVPDFERRAEGHNSLAVALSQLALNLLRSVEHDA